MKSKIFPLLALALGLMAQNGQAAELTYGPPTGSPLLSVAPVVQPVGDAN